MTVGVTAREGNGSQAVKEQRPPWEREAIDDSSTAKSCAEKERSGSTAVRSHPAKLDNMIRGDRGGLASLTAAGVRGLGRAARREGSRSSLLSDGEQSRHGRAPAAGEVENHSTHSILWGAAAALTEEKDDLDDDMSVIVTNGEVSREEEKRTDVADRISELWSKLPLSKLKIVVGELFLRFLLQVVGDHNE